MSTKNLAKTVIEGGRSGSYQHEVAEYAHKERAAERAYLRLAEKDPEATEGIVAPIRKVAYPDFADKLRPAYRFLDSRVGKNWNRTRSVIFERFDSRSTPGRHVLFDHILRDVADNDNQEGHRRFASYYVDDQGILRKRKENYSRGAVPKQLKPKELRAIMDFLGCRKIKTCGARLVWQHPTRFPEHIRAFIGAYGGVARIPSQLDYIYVDNSGEPITYVVDEAITKKYGWPPRLSFRPAVDVHYRQGKLLNKVEESYFRSLPKHIQVAILRAGGDVIVNDQVA